MTEKLLAGAKWNPFNQQICQQQWPDIPVMSLFSKYVSNQELGELFTLDGPYWSVTQQHLEQEGAWWHSG